MRLLGNVNVAFKGCRTERGSQNKTKRVFAGGDTGHQLRPGGGCQLGYSRLRAQVQRDENAHELVLGELGRR